MEIENLGSADPLSHILIVRQTGREPDYSDLVLKLSTDESHSGSHYLEHTSRGP